MRYADLIARVTGLCVAVAGATLAGRAVGVAVPGGLRRVDAAALGSLSLPATVAVLVGGALVVAGLAVLIGRGRAVAVSVGGAVAVVAVASLAVGVGSAVVVVGVGAVALALLLAGSSTGDRTAG